MADVLTPQIPSTPAPTAPLAPPANLAPPKPPTPSVSGVGGGSGLKIGPVQNTAPPPPQAPAPLPAAPAPVAPMPRPATPQTRLAPSPVRPQPTQNADTVAAARQAMPWLDNITSQAGNLVNRARDFGEQAYVTRAMHNPDVPPLVGLGATANLPEGIRGPAESALGMAQRGFSGENGHANFANIVGGLGKPLIAPLLGTPAGMPLMAGMYGMMTGGESGDAAYQYFKPVIDRFRSFG